MREAYSGGATRRIIHPTEGGEGRGGARRGSEATLVYLAASLDGPMFVYINKLYERGEGREARMKEIL